jgi:monoterpene epsilon-lactone hydrolase
MEWYAAMASTEMQAIVDQLWSEGRPEMSSVAELRANFEAMAGAFPLPDAVTCDPVRIGDLRAEWHRPAGAGDDAAILYLHGGGYVVGSLATHRTLVAAIAAAAAIPALAIDYRLAPEWPFPAALEDATAAYRWLLAQGIAPERVVVAGDSAGGGLTLATLVALRDAKTPLPAAAVCLSPWVDLEGVGESMTVRAARDPIISRDLVVWLARKYLGALDSRTPLAAPLYAELGGLPPLLIQVGEAETLYDDAVRIAERATKAGVVVTLDPWPDMIHVWQLFAPMAPEGRDAIAAIGRFIRRHVP